MNFKERIKTFLMNRLGNVRLSVLSLMIINKYERY